MEATPMTKDSYVGLVYSAVVISCRFQDDEGHYFQAINNENPGCSGMGNDSNEAVADLKARIEAMVEFHIKHPRVGSDEVAPPSTEAANDRSYETFFLAELVASGAEVTSTKEVILKPLFKD
jgi:predicted RNase H-like HicB family nuclease